MNILAYIVYILITFVITIVVGRICYRNGRCYIHEIIFDDDKLGDTINLLLLICYYLVNLGYAMVMIYLWEDVTSYQVLISSISIMVSRIVLTLALLHYGNMGAIYVFGKSKQQLSNPSNNNV